MGVHLFARSLAQKTRESVGGGRRASGPVAVLAAGVALLCVAVAGPTPVPGLALVGVLGLVSAGDGDLDSLRGAVERALDGEDVDFSTDRDDDFGRLCGAVGDLAERAREGDSDRSGRPDRADGDWALQETERRLQLALEGTDTGIWEWNLESGEVTWDETSEGLVGLAPGEFGGTYEDFERRLHPEDRDRVRETVDAAIAAGETYHAEFRLFHEDGSVLWVEARGRHATGPDGSDHLVGTNHDITDRKEAERQLREREQRLQRYKEYTDAVLDSIDDVFYVVGPDLQLQRWNRSLVETTGYDDEEIPSLHPTQLVVEEDEAAILEAIQESFETGSSRAEARVRTKDGDAIPYEFAGAVLEDPDGDTILVGVGRDVSERVRRERELERTTDLLTIAGEVADVGGWSVDVSGESPSAEWTDKMYDIFELPGADPPAVADVYDFYHPDDRARHRRAVERATGTGEGWSQELRLTTAEGTERWVRNIGRPVIEDGDVVEIRGSVQDVTDRKERELALESLHEATRGLLRTETAAATADLVVETGRSVLDVEGTAVYLLDAQSNELDAVACTDGFEDRTAGAPSVRAGEESPVWDCFVTGTSMVFDDTGTVDRSRLFAAGGGLVVPIGDRGVFVVATSGPTVDDGTRRLAETLVATAEAAFDRIDSEEALQRREAQLERRNRRLERQIRITDIIRRIDQSLVGASSREEVETTVCDRLVESEDVAFAWVGRTDAAGERLTPRAWAGTGEEYLDAMSFDLDSPAGQPAAVTASTGDPTVVGNVLGELKRDAWHRAAVEHQFHSVVSVPLAFEDYFDGVLTVYGSEPDAFGDLEASVFAELGETIAHSITAVETRQALHSETLVELAMELDPDESFLGRVAGAAGCEVCFEGLATHTSDEVRFFFSVTDGTATAVASVLDGFVSVLDSRLVADTETQVLFEATVAGGVLPARLVRHGARPQSVAATTETMEVVVDVPTSRDVRSFVEMVRDAAPSATLSGRRTVERATDTRHEFVESLFDSLTDRQLEVLRTAHLAGFFEWPRRSTGEEVAEMLGVSQPTVNRHLRHGQQRLFEQLFDESGLEHVRVDPPE
jgi:PAS domain S-box-containing protein